MASLSVWTSNVTHLIEETVTKIIKSDDASDISYDAINIANFSVDEITGLLNEEFNKLVKLTMADSTLHIIAVVPCFDNNSVRQIKYLYEGCENTPHNISLHILGLASGLASLMEHGIPKNVLGKNQTDAINTLKNIGKTGKFSFSYTLIDDYASNGASIGFTIESLGYYIALIQLALTQNYYSVLSPALLSAHNGDNLSIGVSSLSFNRKSATDQLLGHGFLAALDKVGINDTNVDAQKAAHEAEMFLSNIADRYPVLYNKSIRPLYKDHGMTEGKAVAEAAEIIESDLASLRTEILNILKDDTLSLPEKEAILAMILGRDNHNLHGIQYEHEGTILDDICNDPLNLYVKAYNDYCIDSKLLPVRGDFDALKIKIWDEEKGEYKDVPENHEALNPLPEIKRLKQQILNTTSFLREKKEELENLKKSVDLRKNVEEIRKQWHKPEGDLRDIEYKEQPLDEKYIPAPGVEIKNTVDLRKYFRPVRNQLSLGSCTSFATSALYEAMMTRGGVSDIEYMSPGYLFYYSNVLKGRPSGGSNYHDQLEVLGKHGICQDSLYEYNVQNPDKKPSESAENDAKLHRALAAKQIPTVKLQDKEKTLKHNHKLITSALSEGYPIGISLKIYDNLGKDGPFILHPKDSKGAKEDGYHAMVIAGYSEENGFYIVRNSWGSGFGDEGYCYIPYTYIDDPEYLDFACIITEITDTSENVRIEIPTVLANFGATETEIRIAATRNAIFSVKLELEESQKFYAEYYKYYQKLILRLTMPKVQNDIRKAAEIGQAHHFINVDETKRELENSFVAKLKEYKKNLTKSILSCFGGAICFGMAWYYTDSLVMMILFIIAAGLGILLWLGFKWWVRLKRKALQQQLDEVAVNAKRQAEILLEMQIRFHVAGMWLSSFHKLSMEITEVYDRLVSFNDTLREWQKDYSLKIEKNTPVEGIMFRELDPSSRLEGFFQNHKKDIVDKIDLLSVFKDYQANLEDLEKSRNNLHLTVSHAISALMSDFNIVNFLLGDSYPYLENIELGSELDTLIQVGQPSYRNQERNATSPVRMLIGNVEMQRSSAWNAAIMPFFPLRPVILQIEDPTTLILLTLHPQTLE